MQLWSEFNVNASLDEYENKWPITGCIDFCKYHIRVSKHSSRNHGCHFVNDVLGFILVSENCCILFLISQEFVLNGPNNNKPACV